jgi:hypothetical protein
VIERSQDARLRDISEQITNGQVALWKFQSIIYAFEKQHKVTMLMVL